MHSQNMRLPVNLDSQIALWIRILRRCKRVAVPRATEYRGEFLTRPPDEKDVLSDSSDVVLTRLGRANEWTSYALPNWRLVYIMANTNTAII